MSVGIISKSDVYLHNSCYSQREHVDFFDGNGSFRCPACNGTDYKIYFVQKCVFTNLQSTAEDTSPASDPRKIERKNGVEPPIDPNMIPIADEPPVADEPPEYWLSLPQNRKKPPKRIQETLIDDEIQTAILERIEKEENENNAEVEQLFTDGKYQEVIKKCQELLGHKIHNSDIHRNIEKILKKAQDKENLSKINSKIDPYLKNIEYYSTEMREHLEIKKAKNPDELDYINQCQANLLANIANERNQIADIYNVFHYYQDAIEGFTKAIRSYKEAIGLEFDKPDFKADLWKNLASTYVNIADIYKTIDDLVDNSQKFLYRAFYAVKQALSHCKEESDLNDHIQTMLINLNKKLDNINSPQEHFHLVNKKINAMRRGG